MNLLFLSSVYPDASQPSRGTYNAALCRALAERHTVRVVAPRSWREFWPYRLRNGRWNTAVEDIQSAVSVAFPCHYYPPGFHAHRYGEWMWRSVKRTVSRLHREQAVDAVLSYWVHPDGDAGLQAARSCDVPSAVIVGGSDVLLLPREPKRRREIQRVLRDTDLIFTVSEGLRNAVIELEVDQAKVHTVYQGTETQHFHPGPKSDAREKLQLPANAEVLVWVGRMVEVKRLDLLVKAFQSIASTRPEAVLCLIGWGPQRADCERQVHAAGLTDRVRFVGSVTPATLGDWYRAADLTVLSSDSEGLPNVLRESLACGTPYVATDVGNIREIDNGRFGKFVDRGDAAQLSHAINEALEKADGSHKVSDYVPRTWHDMADEVVRLFGTVGRLHDDVKPSATESRQRGQHREHVALSR